MRRIPLFALSSLLLALACAKPTPEPVEPGKVAIDLPGPPPAPELSAAELQATVAFLADDAQQGRAPGTEADVRVQTWLIEQMEAVELEPGGRSGYLQTFEVGDGVRLRKDQSSLLGSIAHTLVPFGHDTGATPVAGKLVFVGHGIPGEGENQGDFANIKLEGAIAVALVGSADPHAPVALTRAQSKLIAARDRGAVGFVLWDPDRDSAWPNHGEFSELNIPAVFVGKSGTEALRAALRAKPNAAPKLGASSKAKLELHTPIEPVELHTANIIGELVGSDPHHTRRRIVIGAHMDHLGLGTSTSLAPGEQAIHNGADDNASGVAVVLGLAKTLGRLPPEQRPHDIVFVLFGAEEMGLLGSKHMLEEMSVEERGHIIAMLNFDMVGRLEERLSLNGTGTASEWAELIEQCNQGEAALQIDGTPDGWGPSDHAAFYGEKIPVLHFFSGTHEDYHRPSDDIDKLDYEGAAKIGELAGRITIELLGRTQLTYVEVARPSQKTEFRVSLGTMPDYGRDVDGMALAGVREGGPAAAAGLQKGDVIKRIGTREIHNIDDYMASFGELQPGVAVEIEWDRDGTRQTAQLVPAAPREQ